MQYRFDELLQRMVYDLGIDNVDLPRVIAIAEEIAALDVESRAYLMTRLAMMYREEEDKNY